MSLDLSPGIYHGALIEVVEAEGTGLLGDHTAGAAVLTVASGGFSAIGKCSVLGNTYDYVREDASLAISPVLVADAEDGTPVIALTPDGQPETRKTAVFDLDMIGEEDETGEEDPNLPHAVIPGEWAGYYPIGTYPPGTFIDVEDTTYGYRVKGRPHDAPSLDGRYIVAGTLPPPDLTDLLPPDNATTVTPIGGIGSMFYRWTEITNNDPVTYRLHVRAGADPTTDGTYEVAAGVGLTSAAVRKLKDGTAIVSDPVTPVVYHHIVTVEDADGPGPASTPGTGSPAQITGPDIAVNAITADHIQFNTLSGETVTGLNVQTAATGKRTRLDSDDFSFYSGDPDETTPASLVMSKIGTDFRLDLNGTNAAGSWPFLHLITTVVGGVGSSRLLLQADTIDLEGLIGAGHIGAGTFRDDLDARIATQSTDSTEVTGLINSVGPTLTMTTGSVGTGAFRDSVDARVTALGTWTAYTPTFTASVTNPTLANFTVSGRYVQVGKTVNFVALFTCNTAANMGSGNYQFGLPVAARATNEVVCIAQQSGPNHGYQGRGASTTTINLFLTSTDAVATVTSTGMAAATSIRISGTYEAA